ncbi:MAG: class I mannose-6-phosphate isomerase [Erysipelotrichaceae bacterium]|jgi:mannose-6-phosphate isomerase class I|nr:class I mannose-6-phosphate isomerase [Erysipelotrichaceae bacterium]
MPELYHILPVFNQRLYGGHDLSKRYGFVTDLANIGECYNVIAMPGHLDCIVCETGEKLSSFYQNNQELFGSNTPTMPVRAAMANTISPMSVQLHPSDAYALAHDGRLGKPDGVYFIGGKSTMELGHYAKTREEFKKKVENEDWEHLLRYVDCEAGQFVDVPYGTLHAFGGGLTLIEFSQNADLTYRLYDYNRIDPQTGKTRELHIEKVLDCVNIPDQTIDMVELYPYEKDGCQLTLFHDEPGVYTAGRIVVSGSGSFLLPEFYFLIGLCGSGKINGKNFKGGETLFVPCHYGPVQLQGNLEIGYLTFRQKEKSHG